MVQRSVSSSIAVAALVASCVVFGCRKSDAECAVGSDCASGACDVSGRCVAVVSPDGDVPDAGPAPYDGAPVDLGDTGVAGCVPNHDGTIDRSELPMLPGLHESLLAAENATWDTTGAAESDGSRAWDLTVAFSGDHAASFDTIAPDGAWWASAFPSATYAVKLSDTQDWLGVFAAGSTLKLLGVVSPTSASPQTELTYANPVGTVETPLAVGASWSWTSNVSGTADGVPAAYQEKFENAVDARGTLKTPFGTFDVLRVRTTLTRTVGVVPTVTRSFAFPAECFGAVASVTSQAGETGAEFSNVAEVRRLTP